MLNETFKEAKSFLINAGVAFPQDYRTHRHCLSIVIDERLTRPILITPYRFAMNKRSLARLYEIVLNDEKSFGMKRVQLLIKVMNSVINTGFRKGCFLSHNIETGKYTLKGVEVLGIFFDIVSEALNYSCGKQTTLKHLGDVYSVLGGFQGCFSFFYECMKATETSIPSFEEPGPVVIGHLPNIRCYTCKYASSEQGVRTCNKCQVEVTPDDLKKHPKRYRDAEYDADEGEEALYSAVIDERMTGCTDYQPRFR